jgi:hypothetical protein
MGGERNISRMTLKTVPRKLNRMPVPSALPAWPRSAMGAPSKRVATDEGVPGILIRIAEIKPPEIPPI